VGVADKPASQRAAYRAHRDRMNEIVERLRHLPSSAPAPVSHQTSADYFLAEAEVWLTLADAH
jgi:hypothetical protein